MNGNPLQDLKEHLLWIQRVAPRYRADQYADWLLAVERMEAEIRQVREERDANRVEIAMLATGHSRIQETKIPEMAQYANGRGWLGLFNTQED